MAATNTQPARRCNVPPLRATIGIHIEASATEPAAMCRTRSDFNMR